MRVSHPWAATILLCWAVTASVVRVIDGDTAVFSADIWPGLTATVAVRIIGIDTPEMYGLTKADGEKARAFAVAWLDKGDVLLTGCKMDSFGRFLADVTRDGKSLASDLLAAGHAVKR